MRIKCLSGITIFLLTCQISLFAETRYVGGDISLLPEYQKAGAVYKTHSGEKISDALQFFHEEGMNAMRVRLFVNPENYSEKDKDVNACQNLEYIIPLCKDIVDHGFKLMLDFHYSDTWADPGAQWTPSAWKDLNDEELENEIYLYTKDVLSALNNNGITPAFIQPGNEISYGMLWGSKGAKESELKKCFYGSNANWSRLGALLNNAIKACREEAPDAKIILHTERAGDSRVLMNFYNWMDKLNVDYDIIGLSYYPYFHGGLDILGNSLTQLENRFKDKNIMIVETGYPYKWEVPGTQHDFSSEWKYTNAGQNKFATDLVAELEKHPAVDGLFWWWMEYNAFGTSLSGWYNAPLFDSTTGRATSALTTICSFATSDSGVALSSLSPEVFNSGNAFYDMNGIKVSEPEARKIYIHDGKKILKR